MGRASLSEDEAFWIDPCGSIHTFFMRVPIDVVFLDADERVLRAVPNVRPWRPYVGCSGARSVLELAAGSIERRGIRAGDAMALR